MPLLFPNVSTLGITRDTRFTDAGFQYGTAKKLAIAGTINDLANGFGISGVWTGQQGVLNTIANDRNYQDLYINGVSFGSGRIESITFDAGRDVSIKGYQATISVYDSGNLFNLTGTYYGGIDTSNLQYVQTFNENHAFERKVNGGYSYSHDANVQFTSGVGQLNAIGAAQSFVRSIFTGANLGFAFYSGYTNKQGKRYFTESYNLIDNTCAFRESFDFDTDSGNYSAVNTRNITMDERGIITATENGTIHGIENPNYQNALSAIGGEMAGAYTRCASAAALYFPTSAALISAPITQGRLIDIFNNNVTYNVTFDNSPINLLTYFWDYTQQASQKDGVGTVVEAGTVVGRGSNTSTAFTNARLGFNTVLAGIAGRVNTIFASTFSPTTNYLESKQQSFAPVQGQCGYSYAYSNDPTLIANNGVRRLEMSIENNAPVYSYNKINIFNKKEIIQNNYQSTVGSANVSARVEGDKSAVFSTLLASAKNGINANLPQGNDRYLAGYSYSYNQNANSLTASALWNFNQVAQPTTSPP